MFTESEYNTLHSLVFRPDYSGYKPSVVEIPNGDGKADSEKRYAHVATKYFATEQQRADLMPFLERAHAMALDVAEALALKPMYWPRIEYGALRILDYPPGSVSNTHEDFDLFTLMMFRDQPDRFKAVETFGTAADRKVLARMHAINPQSHLGQLGTEIGLGAATPHCVLPSDTRQRSIVYFAIPDHATPLPSGVLVRDWLNERMARSRTSFKAYE